MGIYYLKGMIKKIAFLTSAKMLAISVQCPCESLWQQVHGLSVDAAVLS